MKHVDTPQTRCHVGVARGDITPPIGIYHRMWGAAVHDCATAVHRPLLATLLWLQPTSDNSKQAQLVVAMDHCILDGAEMTQIRQAVSAATGLLANHVLIALSHTHGSGWMSRTRSHFHGGELIGPYLDDLAKTIAHLALHAQRSVQPAAIVYGQPRLTAAEAQFQSEVSELATLVPQTMKISMRISNEQHDAIVHAIAARQPDNARRLVEDHVTSTRDAFIGLRLGDLR